MSHDPVIRSRTNALVQRARAVVAGKERGFVALEGERLVEDALRSGHALEVVLVAEDREEWAANLARRNVRVQRLDAELVAHVSSLETSPGILAIAPIPKPCDWTTLALDESALVLVVAGIADPGNLGALARAAEAFGARALVVTSGGASPWNGKALRGSMGSLLRLPVAHGVDPDACARTLSELGVRQVCAATRDGADPARFDWKGPLALWITGEVGAVPRAAARFERLTIPIATGVESLNVTVAASVLLFSAGRVARKPRG